MPDPIALTVLELRQAANYLQRAASSYLDHSCNDFDLPDTPAHRALLAAADAHEVRSGGSAVATLYVTENQRLNTLDTLLLGYLGYRAMAIADRLEQALPTPVCAAELDTMARLLAMLTKNEYDEYATGKGEEEGLLPAAPEGRALAEAVVRHKGGANVEKTVKKVLASNKDQASQGYELFDTWILSYLAMRLATLAKIAPAQGIGFSEAELPLQPLIEREKALKNAPPSTKIVAPGISKDWKKYCKYLLDAHAEQHAEASDAARPADLQLTSLGRRHTPKRIAIPIDY